MLKNMSLMPCEKKIQVARPEKSKVNKIESDRAQYSNYDLESCMIDRASKEDPKLDDTHFKAYFSQYFNRMNSNIDEKYLYITGQ